MRIKEAEHSPTGALLKGGLQLLGDRVIAIPHQFPLGHCQRDLLLDTFHQSRILPGHQLHQLHDLLHHPALQPKRGGILKHTRKKKKKKKWKKELWGSSSPFLLLGLGGFGGDSDLLATRAAIPRDRLEGPVE